MFSEIYPVASLAWTALSSSISHADLFITQEGTRGPTQGPSSPKPALTLDSLNRKASPTNSATFSAPVQSIFQHSQGLFAWLAFEQNQP